MKTRKLFTLTIALVTLLTFALAGCGTKKTPTNQTQDNIDKSQTLNLSMPDITTLDSIQASDSYSLTVLTESMEGLTRIENDGTKDIVKKAGAKSWDTSSDGLVWTFHLQDYNWSDGKKVTAGDYVYAWKRLLDPKVASSYASFIYCVKGAEEYNKGQGTANGVGVKAVDDNTFEVTLKNPVPYFDQIAGFKALLPLRQDIVEKSGDKYGTDPSQLVYNGPFVVSQWIKGSKVVLTKNSKYWDAANVKLQTVNLLNISESQTEMKMFQTKGIDAISPDAQYDPQLQPQVKSGVLTYLKRNNPETRYVAFNTQDKNKLFTSAKIRQAFSIAIDRNTVINKVYNSPYTEAYGWIPFAVELGSGQEYRKLVPEEPLKSIMNEDPKALFQQGLKDLGLDPNGNYTVTLLNYGDSTFKRTLCEYYQNLWHTKLGVNVKIDSVADFGQMSAKVDKGDFEVCVRDWVADFNDVISFLNIFRTGDPNNTALYSNPQYDTLVAQADKEADPQKKANIVKRAEELLIKTDAAVSPVYYGTQNTYTYSYVKGLQYPLFISSFEFKNAYIQGKQ